MGLFNSTKFENFEDLFWEQIKDLYDAEQRLTEALPKMAEKAHDRSLEQAFKNHLNETRHHVKRLEEIFRRDNKTPDRETCDAMKGLISEGEDVVDAKGDEAVIDAALIAAAQRVEHYEIAGYGTARDFARRLGKEEAAQLLQSTLDEESAANELLNDLAQNSINRQAVAASARA